MKLLYLLPVILFACKAPAPVQYLENSLDTTGISRVGNIELTIQKGDLLGIQIYSDNPTASRIYNLADSYDPDVNYGPVNPSIQKTGYLVGGDGTVSIKGVGPLRAEGLTKAQLSDTLVIFFRENKLLSNPVCDIRFLNNRISVIGEVARPNVYSVPSERVTLLEAIGMAGDLTAFARRDNITVVRQVNGQRIFGRLDLNEESIFNSPFYYLRQNDVVVVDKTTKRKREPQQARTRETVAITTGIVTTIAILIRVLTR